MLAEVNTSYPPRLTGAESAAWICSARRAASAASATPSSSSTNSSPPKRATVSAGPTHASSRAATIRSSSSPFRWPSESVTSLKRSRSRNTTANGRGAPSSPVRAAAWASRVPNRVRLGRSVSAS